MVKSKTIKIKRQFKICPNCGYKDGFHIMFEAQPKKAGIYKIKLICPSCHAIYDVGMKTKL